MKKSSAFYSEFLAGFSGQFSFFALPKDAEPLELKQVKTNIGGIES